MFISWTDRIKWFVLIFALIFALASAAQYLYVKTQLNDILHSELHATANKFLEALEYKNGTVDIEKYYNLSPTAPEYLVTLSSGFIFDIEADSSSPILGLLPDVKFPALSPIVYKHPIKYTSEAGEKWYILAKHLKGGQLLLGITRISDVYDQEKKLIDMATRFGSTIEEAKKLRNSLIDGAVAFALIDDTGRLLRAIGGVPIMANPISVGALTEDLFERLISGKMCLVFREPFFDTSGKPAGTITLVRDVSLKHIALEKQIAFNATIAIFSFIAFIVFALYFSRRAELEKREIRQAFQNYFSPQIMEAILKEPASLKLGGQRREVTILFSDIRSFTSLSEKLSPQKLTQLLQEYFTEMTEEVLATDGIVDKFIGDAIMAFWGAPIDQPDQADRAVTTAINMTKRLKRLQDKWISEGYPLLDIGIGINLGVATVGNMGSAKRFDYTVIGDAVNAAARMEGLNKKYKSHIIISESTKRHLSIPVVTKDFGEVVLEGSQIPIRIYEVHLD